MSSSIFLIQFVPNDDGRICEDTSITIDDSVITDELLKKIEDKFEIEKLSISEFYDSNEKTVCEFISNNKLDEIVDFLKDQFVSLINEAHEDFNGTIIEKNSVENYSHEIFALLSITKLFELKLNNFTGMDNVKLKVSR